MTDNTARAGGANPQVKQVLDWLKSQINSNSGIAEEWHEGANFYVKLKSGLIVQGGSAPLDPGSGSYFRHGNVSFRIAFSSSSYLCFVGSQVNIDRGYCKSKTAASCVVGVSAKYNASCGSTSVDWLAIGY